MSAVPSWCGTIKVQRNVVLQESGNPNSGNTEDLVQKFMTPKVLESKLHGYTVHQTMLKTFSLPTDAHNVKKHRVIKTF